MAIEAINVIKNAEQKAAEIVSQAESAANDALVKKGTEVKQKLDKAKLDNLKLITEATHKAEQTAAKMTEKSQIEADAEVKSIENEILKKKDVAIKLVKEAIMSE